MLAVIERHLTKKGKVALANRLDMSRTTLDEVYALGEPKSPGVARRIERAYNETLRENKGYLAYDAEAKRRQLRAAIDVMSPAAMLAVYDTVMTQLLDDMAKNYEPLTAPDAEADAAEDEAAAAEDAGLASAQPATGRTPASA